MPTYAKRSAIEGAVTELGVTIGSTSQAVGTHTVLTEAILTFADCSDYDVGEEITEATSTETGRVYWNDGTHLGIIEASGEFTGGEVITGGTSGETETPTSVLNLLNRSAATPRRQGILHTHSVSGDAVTPQTIYLDRKTTWFLLVTISGGTLTINSATDVPVLALPAGVPYAWRNDHTINPMVLTFSAAITATLYELDCDQNPLADTFYQG